jgi:predicted MFS family arabinose efflux permease
MLFIIVQEGPGEQVLGLTDAKAWLLIGFLWVAYFLNYCDRQVIYAIFPVLKAELGFTNAQLGLTGAIFIWSTGLTSPFAGMCSGYSRRRLVLANLLLWSATTFLTGFSTSPTMLLTGRALLGITEALFIPLAVSLIGSSLPARFWARAMGLFFTAQLCGVVVGGSLGGWISERFGWRCSFFALGIIGAVFAGPLAMFFGRLPARLPSQDDRQGPGSFFLEVWRAPSFVSLCVCFPVFLVVLTILYAWFASALHDRFGLGLADAAFAATAYLQSGTGAGLLAGSLLSDRLYLRKKKSRFLLLAAAMVFGAPWVVLLSHASSLTMVELGAAGFGLANGIFTANLMVAPFDVVSERSRTAAIAVISAIAPPFSGLGSFLTGVWKDSIGIPKLMTFLATGMLVAGIALIVCTFLFFEGDYKRRQASLVAQAESIL